MINLITNLHVIITPVNATLSSESLILLLRSVVCQTLKFVTTMNSKEPTVVRDLQDLQKTIRINLLIKIRLSIDFTISNFYCTLSHLRLEWIL